MRITAATDVGLRHEQNQDCYKIGRLSDDSYWMILCDGMGGVTSGGEASFITVNYLEQIIKEILIGVIGEENIKSFMLDSVKRANTLVFNLARDMQQVFSMGTTIVLAIIRNNDVYIVHAGDSRAYHITKKHISQITTDHSVVQELLASGKITELQARNHPNRNIITSALGIEEDLRLDYNRIRLSKGDSLLLCSDGLSNMADDQKMLSIVRESDFYQSTKNLINYAVDAGGFDNITALLLQAD
ncbi:MAG: Stp1/IreP family PP2C-type Ser/Thr phosphatase [Oscillospiraceae bacterium]|nr:Stp1/IreP family PP2C-type Ser/Thr phosphatase [Oscillospiraceae bacterium]